MLPKTALQLEFELDKMTQERNRWRFICVASALIILTVQLVSALW